MLIKDPKKRLTAQQVLQHDWFKKFDPKLDIPDAVDKLDIAVFQQLKAYKSSSYFQRAAMNILVKLSTKESLSKLTDQFKALDLDGTGLINANEIKTYIESQKLNLSENEIQAMIDELDYAGNGKINYSEFLAATIDTATFFDEQKLRCVFSMFDIEGTNRITAQEMFYAFQKLGQNVPLADIEQLIKEHDTAKDGAISFQEFK